MARALALLALLLFPLGPAWAAGREVEVTGTGLTSLEAITNGLIQALEQVRGVSMVSVQLAVSELAAEVKGDERSATMNERHQAATGKLTGGYVSSYRVLSVMGAAPVSALMSVTVEVFEPKGLGNETRRRIAVMAFATSGASAKSPSPLADALRDRITSHLVQARRFAVVDRAQDGAYAQEARLLSGDNVPMAERARLGQVIGADYVVTGKFRQTAGSSSSRVLDLTGEVITSSTAGSAEADYQVIEIATRQVKYAGSMRISGGDTDRVAAGIADEITQAIYPMMLIRFADPSNLIINQGGGSLQAGQRFRAMVVGEAMIDPYTKESLGSVEEQAAIVEVKRVDAKLSYARLVSGQLPAQTGEDVSIVLRPGAAAVAIATPRPARRAAGAATPATGITKLPFDP